MKKSNIIVIITVGLIMLTTVLMYSIGVKYENKHINEHKPELKEVLIPSYSVILAHKDADIHILQSDTSMLKIEIDNDKPISDSLYYVSNDTLHIVAGKRVYIYGNQLRTIIGDHPLWMGLHRYNTDSLEFIVHGGYAVINPDTEEDCHYQNIRIGLSDEASLSIKDSEVNKLIVNAENSSIQTNSTKIEEMNLVLKDNANGNFFSTQISNIHVQKDSESAIRLYQ